MFPEVDPILGPEMRSTGEVLGMADSYGLAFYKAEEATQQPLPMQGAVLITVAEPDKRKSIVETAKAFVSLGFEVLATAGTQQFLAKHGVQAKPILKMHEGRPNIADAIKNKQIQLVINTPIGKRGKTDDSYIRKTAIKYKVPYITTTTAAAASVQGIAARRQGSSDIKSLQEYHTRIKEG
jgi:carbamoyl-phosphate synthase large subunit